MGASCCLRRPPVRPPRRFPLRLWRAGREVTHIVCQRPCRPWAWKTWPMNWKRMASWGKDRRSAAVFPTSRQWSPVCLHPAWFRNDSSHVTVHASLGNPRVYRRGPAGRKDLAVGVSPRKAVPPTQSPGGAKDKSHYTSSLRPFGARGWRRPGSGGSRRRPNPSGPLGLPRAAPRPAGERAAEWYPHLNQAENCDPTSGRPARPPGRTEEEIARRRLS